MKKLTFIKTKCMLLLLFICTAGMLNAQRNMEKLDRGLVAVQTDNGVFLSWRIFGTDPDDIAFNIYRNGNQVNASPITGPTNMTDDQGSVGDDYTVRPVLNGDEQQPGGAPVSVWDSQVRDVALSNRPSGSHNPNDINVGDLDGDGQYELVVKWYPDNAQDNSNGGFTDNTYLAAYQMDGTFMWIIDLGRNIRSGAHYTQHLVGDYDADGYAEVACKTAPGTRDGTDEYLSDGPAANDDDGADYRNGDGYILSGPEYITIFNGQTGEEMATTDYIVARGDICDWGDCYGNRGDRFNATNAYLDGVNPSMVFQRGYYTRLTMAAFDWDGQTLSHRWTFDSNDPGNGDAYGQGNHSIMCADVDDDGKDELLPGSCAIDDDGSFMWATGHGHGDANHVGDFIPDNGELEIWQVSENSGSEPDHHMIRASDGHVYWGEGSGNDNGRGMIGDMDASHEGQEGWSSSVSGLWSADGDRISGDKPWSTNFRVYWDGDLQDELLNDNTIDEWNGGGTSRVLTLTGESCNGTKATPNISADLFGDWREEVILHDGGSHIYIHTTTTPTEHRLYTLMHDPTYRNAISWQQSSYNQPPHLGFYLGAGVDNVPNPNITLVGGEDCNGVEGGDAYIDECGNCVGGTTGDTACYVDCNGDEDGNAFIDECGKCAGGNTDVTPCAGALQGEAFCDAVGIIESVHAGFNGEGYLNFDNETGSSGNWTIIAGLPGTYELDIKFANGGDAGRDMTINVNGNEEGTFNAPQTEGWADWQTETVSVALDSGVNNLGLVANMADGGPNVDQITWSDDTLNAGGCEDDCNGVQGGLAYVDSCGNCVEGNTGNEPCQQDCNGEWGGNAYEDSCGRCVEGGTGLQPCIAQYELENACTIEGTQASEYSGYTGDGYVNPDNEQGAGLAFKLSVDENNTYTFQVHYANGSTMNKPSSILVNGTEVISSMDFDTTGGWNNWDYQTVNLTLQAGAKSIRFEALDTAGMANMDHVLLMDEGMQIIDCDSVITQVRKEEGINDSFELYPNPTGGKVYFSKKVNYTLMNTTGYTLSSGVSDKLDLSKYPAGLYFIKVNHAIYKVIRK